MILFDVVQVPPCVRQLFILSVLLAQLFGFHCVFFVWCHVFEQFQHARPLLPSRLYKEQFLIDLPKILSWMTVVLHRVRLSHQQRQAHSVGLM